MSPKAKARLARQLRKQRLEDLGVRLEQRAALRRELGRTLPGLDAFQVEQAEKLLTRLNYDVAELRKTLRIKGGAS